MSTALALTQSGVLADSGLIGTFSGLSDSVKTLVKGAITTGAVVFVLFTMVKSRMSAAATTIAILVGAGVIWGVQNVDFLKDKVGTDIKNSSMSTTACPPVQLMVVPGTYATAAAADPNVPVESVRGLADPMKAALGPNLGVTYIPYPAQSFNPTPYQVSKNAGVAATNTALAQKATQCGPRTSFALMGYSQGAAVAGDVAAAIGQGHGPIPAAKIKAVGLVADPNQAPTGVKLLGPPVGGQGFAGPRPVGFGVLTNKVASVCAPGDLVCATPQQTPYLGMFGATLSHLDVPTVEAFLRSLPQRLAALNPVDVVQMLTHPDIAGLTQALAALQHYLSSGVHTSYGRYVVDGQGTTATTALSSWMTHQCAGDATAVQS
jgi:xanthosine utilization system XapX-like protein